MEHVLDEDSVGMSVDFHRDLRTLKATDGLVFGQTARSCSAQPFA